MRRTKSEKRYGFYTSLASRTSNLKSAATPRTASLAHTELCCTGYKSGKRQNPGRYRLYRKGASGVANATPGQTTRAKHKQSPNSVPYFKSIHSTVIHITISYSVCLFILLCVRSGNSHRCVQFAYIHRMEDGERFTLVNMWVWFLVVLHQDETLGVSNPRYFNIFLYFMSRLNSFYIRQVLYWGDFSETVNKNISMRLNSAKEITGMRGQIMHKFPIMSYNRYLLKSWDFILIIKQCSQVTSLSLSTEFPVTTNEWAILTISNLLFLVYPRNKPTASSVLIIQNEELLPISLWLWKSCTTTSSGRQSVTYSQFVHFEANFKQFWCDAGVFYGILFIIEHVKYKYGVVISPECYFCAKSPIFLAFAFSVTTQYISQYRCAWLNLEQC